MVHIWSYWGVTEMDECTWMKKSQMQQLCLGFGVGAGGGGFSFVGFFLCLITFNMNSCLQIEVLAAFEWLTIFRLWSFWPTAVLKEVIQEEGKEKKKKKIKANLANSFLAESSDCMVPPRSLASFTGPTKSSKTIPYQEAWEKASEVYLHNSDFM